MIKLVFFFYHLVIFTSWLTHFLPPLGLKSALTLGFKFIIVLLLDWLHAKARWPSPLFYFIHNWQRRDGFQRVLEWSELKPWLVFELDPLISFFFISSCPGRDSCKNLLHPLSTLIEASYLYLCMVENYISTLSHEWLLFTRGQIWTHYLIACVGN